VAKRVVSEEALPADAGLSALGILMRLGGSIALWLGVYGLILALMQRASLLVIALVAMAVARSFLHVRAGRALWGGQPEAASRVWAYVAFAVLHSALIVPAVGEVPPNLRLMPYLGVAVLVTWPLVVAGLMARPNARAVVAAMRASRRRIFAEDLNITGVSALMTALGTVGVLVMGLMLLISVQSDALAGGFVGWLGILLISGFVLRSFLQARSGIGFLRRGDARAFRTQNDQYILVSILTTVVVGILLLFLTLAQAGLLGLVMLVPVAGCLLSWPLIVRDVGTVELRPDLEEEEPPPIQVGRDRGLVLLGMVLLAMGVLGGVFSLISLLIDPELLANFTRNSPMQPMEGATWLGLASVASSVWAGCECIAMSSRLRPAVAVNLAITAVVTVLGTIAIVKNLGALNTLGGTAAAMRLQITLVAGVQLVVPLALPAMATLQALRKAPKVPIRVDEVF